MAREKERRSFFKNPVKHARQLLEDRRSRKLEITQSELENHIREQYSDPVKSTLLGSPGYVPRSGPHPSCSMLLSPSAAR